MRRRRRRTGGEGSRDRVVRTGERDERALGRMENEKRDEASLKIDSHSLRRPED